MTGRDRIFRDPEHQLVDFAFDSRVAEVFPDMIRRSVPAYETVVPLTGLIAARHLAGAMPARHAGSRSVTPVRGMQPEPPPGSETGACEGFDVAGPSGYRVDRTPAHTREDAPAKGEPAAPETDAGPGRIARAAPRGGLVFDLGCSLGATTLAVLRQVGDAPLRIVAVDNSEPMLERAAGLVDDRRVELRLEDLRATDVSGADVILMNYVLQFLPPADRQALMSRFHKQMAPGGLLLLSEKIGCAGAEEQAFFDATHLAFKQANGYSDLEVGRKRTALENVMIADTEETHRSRLQTAGFEPVNTWFRCLNWASFVAWA